jgi:hypothetical protein
MKPIKIYLIHLVVLTGLTMLLTYGFASAFEVRLGYAYLVFKISIKASSVGCLSLLLFYFRTADQSPLKIILICTLCFVLVTLLGFVATIYTIWYSNIPEEIIIYQQKGLLMNVPHVLSALITGIGTAAILIKMRSKSR